MIHASKCEIALVYHHEQLLRGSADLLPPPVDDRRVYLWSGEFRAWRGADSAVDSALMSGMFARDHRGHSCFLG